MHTLSLAAHHPGSVRLGYTSDGRRNLPGKAFG
jgi:hypothetical protein